MFTTEKLKGKLTTVIMVMKCYTNAIVKLNYHYSILYTLQVVRLVNIYSLNFKTTIPESCHKEILVGD
jgi:hypothetical protein